VNKNFEESLKRIEEATGIKKLTELASVVGSSQQYVSKKSREGDFPAEWAFKVAKKYEISTDWILTGRIPEEKRGQDEDIFFDDLKTWGKEMAGTENLDWMKRQIEAQFPAFKKWKEAKEESEGGENSFPSSKVA
jgi:hypothetical protein